MARNIVILGGGFGGLQAALTLGKQLTRLQKLRNEYNVTVVDRNAYHTFTPLLYEIATTSEQSANTPLLSSLVTYSLHELLAPHGVNVVIGEIRRVDFEKRAVHLAYSKLPFDYLVIALGSESNFFSIPGLREHALSLKTFEDAIAIRTRITELVMAKRHMVRIAIGGGGSTGVELAGEIKEWIPELEEECGAECESQVTIIEAGSTVLGGLDSHIQRAAVRRLEALGVALRTNARIERVSGSTLSLAGGETVPFDLLIWTGGVKSASASETLPLKKESGGRISVVPSLECATEPDSKTGRSVYTVGDIACFIDPRTGKPVPQTARPAIIEGRIAAKNIIAEIERAGHDAPSAGPRVYRPWNYPYIVPVGGKYAVARIGPLVIRGVLAWIFKGVVELNYLISIMPLTAALRIWLRGLRVFIKNDRLG